MKKYDVPHSHHRLDLIAQVNERLSSGWRLCGPLVVSKISSQEFDYLQPMVKELTYLEVLALKSAAPAADRG